MKRIVCLFLVLFFIFSFSSCDNDLDSLEKDPCSKGHDFQKNECKNCNYKATEISQLPLKYRKLIANELKTLSPYSSDIDTLCSVADLYILTVREIESNEKAIQDAINKYNSVPMVRVLQNGVWVWTAHEPSLMEAKNELNAAKSAKAQNEDLLETLKISIELNAQGAAWDIIIEELESESPSNKKIANQLLAVLLAYSHATGNTNPSWKQEIFNTFKEKTGLEIDMSQALS